jgi:hypothetical protein
MHNSFAARLITFVVEFSLSTAFSQGLPRSKDDQDLEVNLNFFAHMLAGWPSLQRI